jgi:hypothetical protein
MVHLWNYKWRHSALFRMSPFTWPLIIPTISFLWPLSLPSLIYLILLVQHSTIHCLAIILYSHVPFPCPCLNKIPTLINQTNCSLFAKLALLNPDREKSFNYIDCFHWAFTTYSFLRPSFCDVLGQNYFQVSDYLYLLCLCSCGPNTWQSNLRGRKIYLAHYFRDSSL